MAQIKRELETLKQRSHAWIKSTTYKLDKWQFQVKKNTVGVTLAEDVKHKFKCAKYEFSQQKREIDENFNQFALKFADKICAPITLKKPKE